MHIALFSFFSYGINFVVISTAETMQLLFYQSSKYGQVNGILEKLANFWHLIVDLLDKIIVHF